MNVARGDAAAEKRPGHGMLSKLLAIVMLVAFIVGAAGCSKTDTEGEPEVVSGTFPWKYTLAAMATQGVR